MPVLPDFLSVIFDPTIDEFQGIPLNGSYQYDDEGVKAQRLTVVDKGILKTFLMSRSPIDGFPQSNGHGRRAPGYEIVSRQSNLFVESTNKVSDADLRKMLIEEVKRQGKPYGLYFDQVTSGYTTTARAGLQAFTVVPLTVYRVYPDGRPDELIRGVDIVGTPLASFAKIMATSDKMDIFNGYCGAESGYVPVAAIAPALLVREIEIQRKERSQDRPPYLSRPSVDVRMAGVASEAQSRMTRRICCCAGGKAAGAVLVVSRPAFGARLRSQDRPRAFTLAQIDDDVVLKAMRDEMERSRQLRVAGGQDAPYFFSYDLTDSEDFHVVATLGSPVSVSRRHVRNPGAEVRVGSYDFDNTGHIFSGRYSGSRYDGNWPMDDNYALLREGFWLLTDRTFKAAEESIGRKRASLKNTAATTEQIADFSKADAVVSLPKVAHKKIDDVAWTQRIAKLSSVFSAYPEVLTSIVELQVIDGVTVSAQLRRHAPCAMRTG